MTATTTAAALTDAKGNDLAVGLIVKVADLGAVEVTRLERKSQRVVLRDTEGNLFARRAARVQAVKAHGRFVKAGSKAAAKILAG